MTSPRRCALYCRVSTAEQTVEPQLHALRAYATARGFEAIEYVDAGESGAKTKRPALDLLLADAKRRRFDLVAITKLDRLARSVHHLVTLARDFEALGIDLVVLDQGVDTTTPSGRLLFHVLSSIAEFERDLIRERTRAGVANARRRGKRIGRPRADVDRLALLRLVRTGATVTAMSRTLGVARSTIRGLLPELLGAAEIVPASEADSAAATRGTEAA